MTDFPSIPGYRIERELGRGGMARVYLALDEKLERYVALKVLHRSLSEDDNITRRFIKEAKTAANLRHSNIVSIHDVGQVGNLYYFSMERLEESLGERIKRGPISPSEASSIIRQVASALDYAHGEGLVHRDIKPENIMFRRDGTTVLTDFGIAKAMGSETRLTGTGTPIGTPYYMSPEQVQGLELDGRADIYALGIVFYEMLTGQDPYAATVTIAIALKHGQELIPQLPSRLAKYQPLLGRMMAMDREKRVPTGAELIKLIDATALVPPKARGRTQSPIGSGTIKADRVQEILMGMDLGARDKKKGERGQRIAKNREEAKERRLSSRTLLVGILSIALVASIVLLVILLSHESGKKLSIESLPSSTSFPAPMAKESDGAPPLPSSSGGEVKPFFEQEREKLAAAQEQEFAKYVSNVRDAYSKGDYQTAQRQINLAASIKPREAEVERLRALIKEGLAAKAESGPSDANAEPSSAPQQDNPPTEESQALQAARPARKPLPPWLTQSQVARERAPESTATHESRPADPISEVGMFGFCFQQLRGPQRDILITQIGRLFTLVIHPTCFFISNRLTFAGTSGGGAYKASFVTTYSGLLLGEGKAVWDLLFDSAGNISDINFVNDTSPFTNIGLLNQVKDRIIGYVQDQIRALRS